MKVIKPGREQKGWALECVCTGKGNGDGGCEAKLLVEEDDMYITSSSAYGEVDYYNTFKCCCCGVETDIPDSNVPGRVKHLMQKKRDERQRDRGIPDQTTS